MNRRQPLVRSRTPRGLRRTTNNESQCRQTSNHNVTQHCNHNVTAGTPVPTIFHSTVIGIATRRTAQPRKGVSCLRLSAQLRLVVEWDSPVPA